MKSVLKKSLALFLCVWMVCMLASSSLVFAGSEEPYVGKPQSIKLSSTSLSMVYGGTATLKATVMPDTVDQRVYWESSNPALVRVDSHGNLTAAQDTASEPSGRQTVTITVTSVLDSSVWAQCKVTVDNDTATKLGSLFSMLMDAVKSLVAILQDPATDLMKQLADFVQQLLGILVNQNPA